MEKVQKKDPVSNPDARIIRVIASETTRLWHLTQPKIPVNAIDQTPGKMSGNNTLQPREPTRISLIGLDDWILMMNADEQDELVE